MGAPVFGILVVFDFLAFLVCFLVALACGLAEEAPAIGVPVCEAAKALDAANSDAIKMAKILFIGWVLELDGVGDASCEGKAYP